MFANPTSSRYPIFNTSDLQFCFTHTFILDDTYIQIGLHIRFTFDSYLHMCLQIVKFAISQQHLKIKYCDIKVVYKATHVRQIVGLFQSFQSTLDKICKCDSIAFDKMTVDLIAIHKAILHIQFQFAYQNLHIKTCIPKFAYQHVNLGSSQDLTLHVPLPKTRLAHFRALQGQKLLKYSNLYVCKSNQSRFWQPFI